MIVTTSPISSQRLVIDVGEREWSIGHGDLSLALSDRIACPWMSADTERKVLEVLLPPQYRHPGIRDESGGILGPFTRVQDPALGWVWSERLPAILGALRGLLEPVVEEAEADPYLNTWKNKCEFVHSLVDVDLDERVCREIAEKESSVGIALEHSRETTRYFETATGRLSARSGVRWDSISSSSRPEVIRLSRSQSLWECDFVASEPSIALSLLTDESVYEVDVYQAWSALFGIPEIERPQVKIRVMAALYGAGRSSLRSMGFADESIEQVERTRDALYQVIEEKFGWRTVGGKSLSEKSIAHWVQGSAADISYQTFNAIARKFSGTDFGPICGLHDGAMWLTPNGWDPGLDVMEVVYQTSDQTFKHHARLRWTRIRE